LWLQMAVHCRLASHPRPIARYRVHGGTLTADTIGRWAEERRYSLGKVEELDPSVADRCVREWVEAHARAHFYQPRFHMAQGRGRDAQREMAQVWSQDIRYFLLYLLTFLPGFLLGTVLRWRSGRPAPGRRDGRTSL